MTGNIKIIIALVFLVLTGTSFSRAQSKDKEILGEGVVVAYQKGTRHPVKPYAGGTATFVEYWIVRVDKWLDKDDRDGRYILVQYNIYERAISNDEINGKLRFTLRERREDEHTDCLGTILAGDKPPFKWRTAELLDYERTDQGKSDKIPPLQSLPCLIADQPPFAVN